MCTSCLTSLGWQVQQGLFGVTWGVSSQGRPVPNWPYIHHVSLVPAVQIQVAELLEHKPILSGGYKAILHVHSGKCLDGRERETALRWGSARTYNPHSSACHPPQRSH